MYKLAKKAASREGFTLVELIVVIAILGILAGIAVPVYSGYISKANEAADQTLLAALNTAFAAACMEHGEYDMTDLPFAPTVDLHDSAVDGEYVTVSHYNSDFQKYYAGNGAFKVFTGLEFVPSQGVFVKEGTASDPAAALRASWAESSFADEDGTVARELLETYDGIGEFFALAAASDMEINRESLLPRVSDEFADKLGINDMFSGLSGAMSETYFEANYPDWSTLTDEQKAIVRGNAAVMFFADDASHRTVADVQNGLGYLMTVLNTANDSTWQEENLSDPSVFANYYYSTLSDDEKEWFNGLSDSAKANEVTTFLNDPDAVKLGDLKLSGKEVVALATATKQLPGGNEAGISTLGAMYALAAGYYKSGYYTGDPAKIPNLGEFDSVIYAIKQGDSFTEYYQEKASTDLNAYLSFMNYLSSNPDINMTSSGAFAGVFNYFAEALGFSAP